MEVRHDEQAQEFVIDLDGGRAYLSYRDEGDGVINLAHTEVPEENEGEGLGSKLAKAAMSHAESNGLKIRPGCAFVQSWLKKHPEYQKLVAK